MISMKHKRILAILLASLLVCTAFFMGCTPQESEADPVPVPPSALSNTPTPAPTMGAGAASDALQDAPAAVLIYLGNQLYNIIPLGEKETFTVDQGNGMVNTILVHETGVYMEHSTCDNQDCVKQGEITLSNYKERILMSWVICLPNQVSIELVVKE